MGIFSEGLIGRNFAFQNGLGLTKMKTSKNSFNKTLRKQPKTANTKSPWAYIREDLLSEGYLRPRFGGLVFERAYCWPYVVACTHNATLAGYIPEMNRHCVCCTLCWELAHSATSELKGL